MLMYNSFKFHADASNKQVASILSTLGYVPSKQLTSNFGSLPGKGKVLSRSLGDHLLEIEFRERLSSKDRSYYWIRWSNIKGGATDPQGLVRLMNDLFFALRMHFIICVNWMQAAVRTTHSVRPYGFQEHSPKIWTKKDKGHLFSFYPVYDYYLFEVRNQEIKQSIDHHLFVFWLDELKYNLLGQARPNDQIKLDLVI